MMSSCSPSLFQSLFFMMLSVGAYAFQDVIVKWIACQISLGQIIFCRSLFALIPIIAVAWVSKESLWSSLQNVQQPRKHFLRALFSFLSLICFVYAFTQMPLANAYTLTFAAPLFMTALSGPLLHEVVRRHRWICVIIGFIGVVIVSRPGTSTFQLASSVAILGGLAYALSLILVRELSKTESNIMIVFSFTCLSIIFSFPFAYFSWGPLTGEQWGWLILIGTLGGSAQFAMTQAFRLSAVSLIAPFDYAALLWAVVFDYLFFAYHPDFYTLTGASFIVMAGLWIVYKERNLSYATDILDKKA